LANKISIINGKAVIKESVELGPKQQLLGIR